MIRTLRKIISNSELTYATLFSCQLPSAVLGLTASMDQLVIVTLMRTLKGNFVQNLYFRNIILVQHLYFICMHTQTMF